MPIPEPSKKVEATITAKKYRRLVLRSRLLGVSQAELIRRGIDRELDVDERAAKHGVQVAIVVRTLPRVLRQIWPRLQD